MAVELISKKRLLRLWFTGAGPYGSSHTSVFLNLIRHANSFLKYKDVRGPPELRAVAHRLRTSALGHGFPHFFANLLFCGPQSYVTLLLSLYSLTIIIIKMQIHFIRQCNEWGLFDFAQFINSWGY